MRKFTVNSLTLFASLMLIFQLASCGGGGGGGSSGGETASTAPTIEQFVSHMVETLGEDVGFEAISIAFEKGYSLKQVADAGFINRLGTAGIISDGKGGTVTPEYSRTVATKTLINAFSADIALLRGWLESNAAKGKNVSAEGAGMALLMKLIQLGYDENQIVEAFLFGYSVRVEWEPFGIQEILIEVIVDESGNVVRPNRSVDTTTFSTPGTETGGGDTGGNPDDGCFINNSSILGSWSYPAGIYLGGGGYAAGSYTFQAGGVGVYLDGAKSLSINWSISCNTMTITTSGSGSSLTWNVTSSSTMETLIRGTMLFLTKN